jgi:hypothetical protein
MVQKRIDSYSPRSKGFPGRPRAKGTKKVRPNKRPKNELDTWVIEEVRKGDRSIWNPNSTPGDPETYEWKDCTEVIIYNTRTGETVTVRDDEGMMAFWEFIKGEAFKWKGGKRILKKTIAKKLRENGYTLTRLD